MMKKFIFTCGDVNGIGPEIIIKTLNRIKDTEHQFIVIIPENAFEEAAEIIKPQFDFDIQKGKKLNSTKQVIVKALKKVLLETGQPTIYSGKTAFNAVIESYKLLKQKKADAVITAPLSKLALNLAGIDYPGHTEIFADLCKVKNYVMMFLSDDMKAALNSIHIPVKKISSGISKKDLKVKLGIVLQTLRKDFIIKHPRIAVLGLNPHAGESGLIGKEEIKNIRPVLDKIPETDGPFSPDAFFAKKLYRNYDLVFGMYHDQVLIPFKMLNFNTGVNFTAGLPIVRTSPDHGTAFDLAGTGRADESSMNEAFRYAELIVKNRNT